MNMDWADFHGSDLCLIRVNPPNPCSSVFYSWSNCGCSERLYPFIIRENMVYARAREYRRGSVRRADHGTGENRATLPEGPASHRGPRLGEGQTGLPDGVGVALRFAGHP